MAANVYNVIWADDQIDSFRRDNDVLNIMKLQTVNLLDFAHTSSELKEKLTEWEDMVDAVITDGNFDKKKTVDIVRSTSGISDVISFISDFNRKKIIPFFLYTGKKELLKEKFTDGELDYFAKRDRIFEKGSFSKMLVRIKEEVDRINSPQFRIRNKYAREFEAAKLIDGAPENLERGLLYLYKEDSWKDVEDYFNPARKIVERIVDSCVEMNILPPHISLNTAQKILQGTLSDYSLSVPLMEKPLAESLRFFLSITQDGSHDANDLQLGVDQYVRQTQNVNLYLSILHIAMDLLLWHERMHKKYENNTNRLWTCSFVHQGIVCLHPSGKFFHSGIYQLENKNGVLKDGDMVGVRSSVPNKNAAKMPAITKFVYETNYIIL
ncbi:MAG: hypothetical protein IJK22_11395 [Bacteroidales bacterium]|nr:hypothetical protein [Bacteroidales bacterium]